MPDAMPTPYDQEQRPADDAGATEAIDLGAAARGRADAPAGTVTPPPPAGGPAAPLRNPYAAASYPASPLDSGAPAPPRPPSDAGISVGDAPPPPRWAPPPADSLATGTMVDEKYQILVKLGQGGMGAVYRARHKLLEKDVALKVIAPHMAQDRNFRARFFREAKVAMEFVHRHAVPVRDFGVTRDGLYYMTMDFSTGRSLRALVEKEGALPPERAVQIVRMILEALSEAHRKRITHRDLKPDNVMIEEQDGKDFAKVLDFGLAKIATGSDDEGPSLVSGEAILGTPAYMSPEQACGEEVDHRADLYAAGIVLFQLLTGELPFKAQTSRQMILKQVSATPPKLHDVKPDLGMPEGLEAVVMKALAKEKTDRYQSADEFRDALEPYSVKGKRPIVQMGGGAHAGAATLPGGGGESKPGTDTITGESTEAFVDGSLTGMTIDRYKILAPIAEGGMGAVYRAEHELMHRACAFKVIKGAHAQDPEVLSRFQREAQVSARFKHPSAVEVYDFGKMGAKAYFMAMELVNGRPLSSRITEQGALPLKDAIEIACQVLDVLEAAHRAGIVHRDLKPDNIMLQEVDGWPNQVKLLDFGIAKMSDTKGEAAKFQTMAGAFFGTPQYSSPEQCKGEPVDARSDLYSLGTIFFEMVTGALPFESETAGGYLVQHMVSPPRKLRDAKPGLAVPSAVEGVIQRSLAKKREDRFSSAAEFSEALKRAADIHPYFEIGDRGVKLGAGPAQVGHSRRAVVLIAIALAAVVGGLVFVFGRGDTSHAGIQLATSPPGEALVTLTPAAGGPPRTERTNAQGALSLAHLAPGEWTLRVAREGFETDERRIRLDRGRTVELPVALLPSRESARRDAEAAREAAEAARIAAESADAAKLAPDLVADGGKGFAEGARAFEAKDYALAKARFDEAAKIFERAKADGEKAAVEVEAVKSLKREMEEARDAAEKALAREYAAKTFERGAEEERAARELAKTQDRQQAQVKLASAKACYAQAAEEARDKLDGLLGDAKSELERQRAAANEARAKDAAGDLYAQAEAARDEAAAKESAGDKPGAIAASKRAADLFGEARAAAGDRQAAAAFAKKMNALLADARVEARKMKQARDSAAAAGAERLAPDDFAEAARRDEVAAKYETDLAAALKDGPEKVALGDRAGIEEQLQFVLEKRREAALGYREAQASAEREGERQRLLRLLAAQRQSAAGAKAAYDAALRDAVAKSADVGEARQKAIEAEAALGDAEAAGKAAEAPDATSEAVQRATEAASKAATLFTEARAFAEAAGRASGGGSDGGAAVGPKAAAERLLASYKRAIEAKDLGALRRCFIDFSPMEPGWRRQFEKEDVFFAVEIGPVSIASDTEADAIVTLTATEGGRAGKPYRARLVLGRSGGAWKIAEVGAAK
jgi:serine/threonine protein kinase